MANSKQNNGLDFTGQVFFIGIDVHKKNWSVTIRTNNLAIKTFSMNPSPIELAKYVRKNYPGAKYFSVYEAGFCGYWIHRELIRLGLCNIIVNPADVPTTNKERSEKRDPIDSRKLSRELENMSLKGIYVPDQQHQAIRSLSRLRFGNVKRRIQIKNRIKGFLHFHGITIPERSEISHWSGTFIKWLKSLKFKEQLDRETLDYLITDLEYQRGRMKEILQTIRKLFLQIPILLYIRSVKGIGTILAFTIYAEIVDIRRFNNLDHLASYVGLIPSVESSGEKEIIKGLTFRHSKNLRYLFVEAAWVAVREDPALTMCYNELIRRTSRKKAIIRIAKKLLNRVRYVWLNETEYVTAVVA
jgi:transposase